MNSEIAPYPTTAALVLAGGQSRRMGQDKALLTVSDGGQSHPLLQHVCTVAQSCASNVYVLTPWPQRYGDLLPAEIVLLQEKHGGAGPMVALAQGWSMILENTQHRHNDPPTWLLVLACDMPALSSTALQTWQQQLNTLDKDEIAALPRYNNRWEPLCGFYHSCCIPSLQRAIKNNVRSFQQWLANERVVALSVTNSNVLRNCNTPTQWRQFLDSASS